MDFLCNIPDLLRLLYSKLQVNWTTLLSAYQKEGLHDATLKLVDFIKSKGIIIGSKHNVNELAEKLKEVGQTKILGGQQSRKLK